MVHYDDHRPPAIDQGIYGITKEEQNSLLPSEALQRLLQQAQEDHRQCVTEARKADVNVDDTCALTWGNVWMRWRQWGAYRAPFKTDDAVLSWSKKWWSKVYGEKQDVSD